MNVESQVYRSGRSVRGFGLGDATTDGTDGATAAAAGAAYAALQADSGYCGSVQQSGTGVNSAVHNFKVAYNASLADPPSAYSGSPVPVGTGNYEPSVAAALTQVLGVAAPAGCPPRGGGTAPAVTCGPGQVLNLDTGKCEKAPVVQPSTGTSGAGPLVAAAVLVGLGAVAVTYAVKRKRHPPAHA